MFCLHLQGLFLHLQGLARSLRWSVSPQMFIAKMKTFLLRHFKDRVSICCITVKDCPEVANEWTACDRDWFVFSCVLWDVTWMEKSMFEDQSWYGNDSISVAGFFGYMAGKLSYMKTCQEKFKRLENSPLGEALRQRAGLPSQRWVKHARALACCRPPAAADSRCSPSALQMLSLTWATPTLSHSDPCSSQQKPSVRRATLQTHQSKWGDQRTLVLQATIKVLLILCFFQLLNES